MSWRETLGVAEAAGEPHAHNPHNAQKTAMPGNSADSADSASADAEETASRLLEALTDACRDLPITPAAVRDALAPADIEGWRNGEINSDTLSAFARALVQRREMDRGKRAPPTKPNGPPASTAVPSGYGFPAKSSAVPGAGIGWPTGQYRTRMPSTVRIALTFGARTIRILATAPRASRKPSRGCGNRPPLLRAVSAALRTERQRRISRGLIPDKTVNLPNDFGKIRRASWAAWVAAGAGTSAPTTPPMITDLSTYAAGGGTACSTRISPSAGNGHAMARWLPRSKCAPNLTE